MSAQRIYLDDDDPRFDEQARLIGVGRDEVMPPGQVRRRIGLNDWLLVVFHDPVWVELAGERTDVSWDSLILWPPGHPHGFGSASGSWRHSWVVFNGRAFAADMNRLGDDCEQVLKLRCLPLILDCLDALLREFHEFERPDNGIVSTRLRLCLREIARERHAHGEPVDALNPVRRASNYIRKHLAESLDVPRVARAVGLSPSRLQQLMRKGIGETVQAHIESCRLREARYWLTHSGLRVVEVAKRVGYPDPFYFSRRFRQAYALSPRQFRDAAQTL